MKGNAVINTVVKHSIKGRLRLFSNSIKYLGDYKEIIEKTLNENDVIKLASLNPITGSILIEYNPLAYKDDIQEIVHRVLNKYSLAISQVKAEKRVNTKQIIKNEKTETSKDILKRVVLNAGTLGYVLVKEKLNLKDFYNVDRFGVFGKFLTIPALVSLYLNKGLLDNGIKGAIRDKKPNADTLTLTSIVSSLLLGNDKSALTITLLSDIAELMTIYAGTIIKSGSITIKTEKAGDDTVVSRIVHLVEDAASKKAPIQDYADKFSTYLVPANFLFAGLTYLLTRNMSRALNMMVIDYSCGIKLSTATAFSAAINNAVRHGVLIKGGNYLEALASADTMILDKTGTLTEGKPAVTDIMIINKDYTEEDILKIAGAAEETSSHPMSVAIINKVKEENIKLPLHGEVITHIARGIETTIDGETVLVGSRLFLEENKISLRNISKKEEKIQSSGGNIIYVAFKGKLIALISVKDKMRENMKKTINNLRYQGVDDIVLLTGDLEEQAKEVALKMGVDGYKAELLPSDKAEQVLKYQSKGAKVVMVGDGINDAPALAYANVGIALGGGSTDVAMEASDITINGDNPMMIPTIMDLSKNTMQVVKQNFGLVIGINSLGLMLSAIGRLPVLWGAILHNSSTIFVVSNSIRLMFFNMERGV